jgi:methyl-accepting chemotaxis protein
MESIECGSEAIKIGIDKVRFAGESFEKLKELQEESNKKVSDISIFSGEIHKSGSEISDIITNIKQLTEQLLQKLGAIDISTNQHAGSIQVIAAYLETVDKISEDLLGLFNGLRCKE